MTATKDQVTGYALDGAIHAGGTALVTWLAGLGLHAGYGVSVPFLGTWGAALAGVVAIGHAAYIATHGFHLSRAEWAAGLSRLAVEAEHEAYAAVLNKATTGETAGSAGN